MPACDIFIITIPKRVSFLQAVQKTVSLADRASLINDAISER